MTSALETVAVQLGPRSYDILVGPGALDALAPRLAGFLRRPRVFILSDETVWRLHGDKMRSTLNAAGLASDVITIAAGEASKRFEELGRVLDDLLRRGAERSDVLIAFGGGVVGDLGGLAASLMKRGMSFVQVPTTLLAQVDSSVGGKTAVNSAAGKNLIGAFYQPRLVIADTHFLATLPKRELAAGYAEVVKYGLINDPAFFGWLEEAGSDVMRLEPQAIARAVAVSCRAKAAIVAEDETETGVRQLLNFGHTFGHALEAANGFGPDLLHGEAVALGSVLALKYSAALNLCDNDAAARAARVLGAAGLPIALGALSGGPYSAGALADWMRADKKAQAGAVTLILARSIGGAFVHPRADLGHVESFLRAEGAG